MNPNKKIPATAKETAIDFFLAIFVSSSILFATASKMNYHKWTHGDFALVGVVGAIMTVFLFILMTPLRILLGVKKHSDSESDDD